MIKNTERQRVLEWIANNPVEPGAKEVMKNNYEITDEDIDNYKYSQLTNSSNKLKDKRDDKKITKKDRELNKKRIEGRVDKFNAKLKRELMRHKDDPDATKIIIDIVYSNLNETYTKMGKGMKLDERTMIMIADGKLNSKARVINKNLRRSPEALYEQMKVELNSDNMKKSEVDNIGKELFNLLNKGSMVITKNENNAPVARRDLIKYKNVISNIKEMNSKWEQDLINSKVQGDIPLILPNNRYGLDNAPSFEVLSERIESLNRQNDDNYRTWRTEVLRSNYLEAAQNTLGENSPEYNEIELLVNQFNTIDFDRFSRTYRAGEIIYMYEMGLSNIDSIITSLKQGLSQVGGE